MSLTDEWIRKMWYIYTMEYYSAIKKNKIMPFAATWMNLETFIQSKGSQRRRNIVWYPLHVESKKKWYELTKQKETHRLRERTYGCLPTLLYLKWITNKDLEYSTWNAFQHAAAWMGGEFGGECICTAESLCCSPETITTLLISYTPIQNKKLKNIYIYYLCFCIEKLA